MSERSTEQIVQALKDMSQDGVFEFWEDGVDLLAEAAARLRALEQEKASIHEMCRNCGCHLMADAPAAALSPAPSEAAQGIDVGPHPNCARCKGTGEAPNAQFRCPCRWSHSPIRRDAEQRLIGANPCADLYRAIDEPQQESR